MWLRHGAAGNSSPNPERFSAMCQSGWSSITQPLPHMSHGSARLGSGPPACKHFPMLGPADRLGGTCQPNAGAGGSQLPRPDPRIKPTFPTPCESIHFHFHRFTNSLFSRTDKYLAFGSKFASGVPISANIRIPRSYAQPTRAHKYRTPIVNSYKQQYMQWAGHLKANIGALLSLMLRGSLMKIPLLRREYRVLYASRRRLQLQVRAHYAQHNTHAF